MIPLLPVPEKFFKETPAPIRWRLLLHGWPGLEPEIGCPRGVRDQRRASKRQQKNSGAGKREDDLERRQGGLERSNHDFDSPAVWLIWY
jgi:hypothetical protein